eukprot:TRINITY_DN14622_c0_g1_i2.p1 TRINITY_DN14622_c0_g1~~TRINITY_DN14622_c0_g1_i2.p1  ORF type:complete len:112 (-),score=36.40 TRINITY_DN14622_c0_g1_i2:82-417(-)
MFIFFGFFFFFFNDTATTEIYTLHIVGSVRCVQETGAKGFLIHKNNGTNQKPAKPTTQQDNFMRAQTAQTLPKPINSSQVYQQNNLKKMQDAQIQIESCLLYTSPSPRDQA